MSEGSGFGQQEAFSVFEAMRPSTFQTVDRIAVATYSLDLVALAALLLSIGPAGEDELNGGPLSFLDALRDLGPRTTIIYQTGRLTVARKHATILHMLDGMLQEVKPLPGASWHPKAILARYLDERGVASWRFWTGSRNFTGGFDREAGLLLLGQRNHKSSNLDSAVFRELFERADWAPEVWQELETVRWSGPEGVSVRKLHWRKLGSKRAFVEDLPDATRTFVVSPFADDAGVAAARSGSKPLKLVTTSLAAQTVRSDPLLEVRVAIPPATNPVIDLSAIGENDMGETTEPIPDAGLHAKIVLSRSKRKNRMWIGSANATRRGMVGPNAEIFAEIDVSDDIADQLESYWDLAGVPLQDTPDEEALELSRRQRLLDEALIEVLRIDFVLHQDSAGLTLASGRNFDGFLKTYTLESWLFTLPDSPRMWVSGSNSVALTSQAVPLALQTILVGFRARSHEEPRVVREWTQSVLYPAFHRVARDRAAAAAYIGQGRLREWLRAQLEGLRPEEPTTWFGAGRTLSRTTRGTLEQSLPFTIENILSAWAKNPGAFESKAKEIAEILTAFHEQLADLAEEERADIERELEDFRPFWAAVEESLTPKEKRRRGA